MEKDYTKYDAISLAQDESFIRWVKSGDAKTKQFWENWLQEFPDKKQVLEEARHLVLAISVKELEPSQTKIDALWNKIDAATTVSPQVQTTKETKIRRMTFVRGLSYAAAAAIVLLISFWFLNPATTAIQSTNAQQLVHALPDKSEIKLNAASKIAYNKKTWKNNRVVELEGEAFFKVQKGSSFTVKTKAGSVRVLGTSFNVFARDGELKVVCFTGKVEVKSNNNDIQILTPGKSTALVANTKLSPPQKIDLKKMATWRTGNFVFENISFGQVIKEVERQFDVTIEIQDKNLLNKRGAYLFETGDLQKALKKICTPLGLKFEIKGKKVVIGN